MKSADSQQVPVAGLVLAAGAGRRMGTPKALVRDPAGVPWVVRAARILTASGCSPVVVVVGAAAAEVRAELTTKPAQVVEATNWTEGMGASLRAGLTALGDLPASASGAAPQAVVVVPVDVPGLAVEVVRRVAAEAQVDALVRAAYGGVPGHPVVIGRDHWAGVIEMARGDEGARPYLRRNRPLFVECADLADGRDVDTVEDLPPGHR
ncbi:nucleotidyltransferase family protein [Kribbella sp. CA-245084]|uniref:nucleotidyltransferase family protein n=1 Tax=Kribbella sp. CA-245084 TaxID=3239940 RepID=UPI003D89D827